MSNNSFKSKSAGAIQPKKLKVWILAWKLSLNAILICRSGGSILVRSVQILHSQFRLEDWD